MLLAETSNDAYISISANIIASNTIMSLDTSSWRSMGNTMVALRGLMHRYEVAKQEWYSSRFSCVVR